MRRALVTAIAVLLPCVVAFKARAASDDLDDKVAAPDAERRSDVTIGFSGGMQLGAASGYPNEAEKIGDPAFRQDATGFGGGGFVWIGGAFRDWFTFAIGTGGGGVSGGSLDAGGGALIFRVETFPAYTLGGAWRDIGFGADFGTGGFTIQRGKEVQADGGSASLVGASFFWEGGRFWRIAAGPTLDYHYYFSQTIDAHLVSLGLRMAFYGGP